MQSRSARSSAPNANTPPRGRGKLMLACTYAALYFGFVALLIFAPDAMSGKELSLGSERTLTLLGANLCVGGGILLLLLAALFPWFLAKSGAPGEDD